MSIQHSFCYKTASPYWIFYIYLSQYFLLQPHLYQNGLLRGYAASGLMTLDNNRHRQIWQPRPPFSGFTSPTSISLVSKILSCLHQRISPHHRWTSCDQGLHSDLCDDMDLLDLCHVNVHPPSPFLDVWLPNKTTGMLSSTTGSLTSVHFWPATPIIFPLASHPCTGVWFNAVSSLSTGIQLDNNCVRLGVSLRLGLRTSQTLP